MPAKYDIKTYQGDSFTLTFTLEGDWSSYLHTFTIKTAYGTSATLTLTSATSAVTRTYSAGTNLTTCVLTMTPAQTSALAQGTVYAYDYQVSNLPTYCQTLLYGTLSLTGEIS
jgi:hypothetical protein